MAVSLRERKIVWIRGPFPCGSAPDISIFKTGLKHMLEEGEKAIVDSGYKDDRRITPSGLHDRKSKLHNNLRARHEAMNMRLKVFNVLDHSFRHSRQLHSVRFFAVANLVQLELVDAPLFRIRISTNKKQKPEISYFS